MTRVATSLSGQLSCTLCFHPHRSRKSSHPSGSAIHLDLWMQVWQIKSAEWYWRILFLLEMIRNATSFRSAKLWSRLLKLGPSCDAHILSPELWSDHTVVTMFSATLVWPCYAMLLRDVIGTFSSQVPAEFQLAHGSTGKLLPVWGMS